MVQIWQKNRTNFADLSGLRFFERVFGSNLQNKSGKTFLQKVFPKKLIELTLNSNMKNSSIQRVFLSDGVIENPADICYTVINR